MLVKTVVLLQTTQIVSACNPRNQHQDEVGSSEEIGFQQFLMVMSNFRPPKPKSTEEEKQALRKEKLRCKNQHSISINTIYRFRCIWINLFSLYLSNTTPGEKKLHHP